MRRVATNSLVSVALARCCTAGKPGSEKENSPSSNQGLAPSPTTVASSSDPTVSPVINNMAASSFVWEEKASDAVPIVEETAEVIPKWKISSRKRKGKSTAAGAKKKKLTKAASRKTVTSKATAVGKNKKGASFSKKNKKVKPVSSQQKKAAPAKAKASKSGAGTQPKPSFKQFVADLAKSKKLRSLSFTQKAITVSKLWKASRKKSIGKKAR